MGRVRLLQCYDRDLDLSRSAERLARLLIGAIGILSSIFYTVPPVKFAYRGFGELGLLVNFGPVLVMGSYYVQRQTLDMEPVILSLVPGFLMWSMIVINEIPDYEEDRQSGKMNLVARFGRKTGVVLYQAGPLCAFGTLAGSVLFGVAPLPVLLGLCGAADCAAIGQGS